MDTTMPHSPQVVDVLFAARLLRASGVRHDRLLRVRVGIAREPQNEACPQLRGVCWRAFGTGTDCNRASVTFQDLSGYVKAQARADVPFCREKRLEDALHVFLCDARSVVLDQHLDLVESRLSNAMQGNGDVAVLGNRVHGIRNQVGYRLAKLARHSDDRWAFSEEPLYFDILRLQLVRIERFSTDSTTGIRSIGCGSLDSR